MDYINMDYINITVLTGIPLTMGYLIFHIYFIINYFHNINLRKEYIELEKTDNLKSGEIKRLKLVNDKINLELKQFKLLLEKKEQEKKEQEKKEQEKKEINSGLGELRYKIPSDKTIDGKEIYYHGIGHLEKDYAWWKPNKNRCIIEYSDKGKIKHPEWETDNISSFCTNYRKSESLNKRRRIKTYYMCMGHKENQ